MKMLGQSIAEYALLIGIVSVAISGMNIYIKRGLQAGIKQSVDQMGSQEDGASQTRFDKKNSGVADIISSQTQDEDDNTNIVEHSPSGSITYRRNESSTFSEFTHSRSVASDENL